MNISANSVSVFSPHSTDILDLEHKLHNPGHWGWKPVFVQKGTLGQFKRKGYTYERKSSPETGLIWTQQ